MASDGLEGPLTVHKDSDEYNIQPNHPLSLSVRLSVERDHEGECMLWELVGVTIYGECVEGNSFKFYTFTH